MKKIEMRRLITLALSAAIMFAPIMNRSVQAQTAEETSPFGVTEEELNTARQQFYADSGFISFSAGPEVVYINDSNIIHQPQEYKIPEPPSVSIANYSSTYSNAYKVGDTRSFYTNPTDNSKVLIQGKLVAQGEHINIWVLDDTDFHAKTGRPCYDNCPLLDIIKKDVGKQISDTFDPIYKAMTDTSTGFAAHAGVQIQAEYKNMLTVGDIGNDGKVNFLLYDLFGDGNSNDGGYTAGFFSNGDFFTVSDGGNEMDMLHIDIGDKQGYKVLEYGTDEEKLDFYGTMAHEFQHLLFYMYYGIYTPDSGYDSDSWINETLSELASAFYTKSGTELVSYSIVSSAAQNSYKEKDSKEYHDFLNHGIHESTLKNYAMERMFAHVMYKNYPNIARDIYSYIETTYPPAKSYTELNQNTAKIKSMPQAVGDFLQAGTDIGNGGENSLALLYYLFMESFAADGGTIYTASPSQTVKPFTPTSPLNNLWAVRSVAGVAKGAVFIDPTSPQGSYYPTSTYEAIPLLSSGGSISLKGYGPPNGKGATHEKFYKLTGGSADIPWLTITSPNDGNETTFYYAAIPQDELIIGNYTYTSGASGASLYPLPKGKLVQIDTQGREVYLFVVTLYKDVTASIEYSWSDAEIELCPVCGKDICECKLEDILADSGLGEITEGGFIKGEAKLMSKGQLTGVTVYEKDADGNLSEVADDDRIIGTGMIIEKDGVKITVVIKGDVDGDGNTGIGDAQDFLEYLVGNKNLEGAYWKAAEDFDTDSAIKRLRAFLSFVMSDK